MDLDKEISSEEVTRRLMGLFNPQRHVREVVERSKSSFRWGMRFLPKAGRDAMYAIYSFCREVDDIADESNVESRKLSDLKEWREEVDRLYEGSPTRPTTMALLHPVKLFRLPKSEFVKVIEGMEMDVLGKMWAPPWVNLYEYCRRVAGAVGLLSIHAFRESGPKASEFAISLGNALQLTNILRDVYEDINNGRLYLPRELLERYKVDTSTPKAVLNDPGLPKVCAEVSRVAHDAYSHSDSLLERLDPIKMRPAVLMKEIYRHVLMALDKRGWHRLDEPVSLSALTKLWVAFRYSVSR